MLAAATLWASPARADTVASLLGNFTINQFSALSLAENRIDVHRVIVFGQLPALRELHAADADGDGVTTQAERDAHAMRLARSLGDSLELTFDGKRVPLRLLRSATSLPAEQGGFSLRVDLDFSAPLSIDGAAVHRLTFANRNYDGRFGWNEIAVTPATAWKVFDTNAFDDSLTGGLTEALRGLPASGPLQERAIHLAMTATAPPAGAVPLGGRAGAARGAAAPADAGSVPIVAGAANGGARTSGADAAASSWTNELQARTHRLVTLISERDAPWPVTLVALLTALVLGAFHAFSPGHGKTVVGAYLIGSRATARHAVFLGTTVTITHSVGVFALGFATLFAAQYVVPERLIPLLSLVSGALVLGMGVTLLWQRWPHRVPSTPAAGASVAHDPERSAAGDRPSLRTLPLAAARLRGVAAASRTASSIGPLVARMQGHASPALAHAHGDGWHSHGGRWHSHVPPASLREAVSWRGLLALGVSGGLVPCPSAMVLLLAAVALNRTAFGLALVLAFSLGLALTLIGVGLAFLYARRWLPAGVGDSQVARWLPGLSAAAIAAIGVGLCVVAATGFQ
jgi:ABC-type nickel/cobalt efflux system permease component RcnA